MKNKKYLYTAKATVTHCVPSLLSCQNNEKSQRERERKKGII